MQDNNPDAVLAVRFYEREVKNEWMSEQSGRPIMEMKDFVRIEVPGNILSVVDTFVNEDHKRRFPIQWAQYQNDKKADSPLAGTPLKDWSILNPAQATELRHFKFYTVEQVAEASDQQIGSIGMMLGMSPQSFREKARVYLAAAKDSSLAMAQAEELKKRDLEINALKEQVARLAELAEKKPVGRPKKEAEVS